MGTISLTSSTLKTFQLLHSNMLLKSVVFLVLIVTVSSDDQVRIKRAKYYSYPSRFYRKPPPPHVVKGAFSYTPPPNLLQDDEPSFRPKVSKKPSNDGLNEEDISNLVKYLSKKDLDKIVEYAGDKERYREESSEKFEFKQYRRPERNSGYRSEDIEQFAQNIHHFKDQDDFIKVVYNDQNMNYAAVKPRILHPTPPSYSDDLNKNPNFNYINDASQPKLIYTNPPENYNTKITYSNHQEPQFTNNIQPSNPNIIYSSSQGQSPNFSPQREQIPSNSQFTNPTFSSNDQGPFSNTPLDTEESMRRYVTYVTVPPINLDNKDTLYTDSETMKEEQLPKPLNLREDDYEVANTEHVPKVVRPDAYKVESFKDLPLMNFHNSKLDTVSSYNVPHYVVTSTKSQSPPSQSSEPIKAPIIEQAPPGYTGKEMSDAHLKAIKIWTHRSKGTAYTLHDDGTLSLEKPRIKTSYGYAP